MTPFIRLHPTDDVLIARTQLVGGTPLESIAVRGLVPAGHKVASRAIAAGEPVRRYNQIIGFASKPIAAGEHVHTHNLWMGEGKGDFARDYAIGADVRPEPAPVEASFLGYRRSDGRVASCPRSTVRPLQHAPLPTTSRARTIHRRWPPIPMWMAWSR